MIVSQSHTCTVLYANEEQKSYSDYFGLIRLPKNETLGTQQIFHKPYNNIAHYISYFRNHLPNDHQQRTKSLNASLFAPYLHFDDQLFFFQTMSSCVLCVVFMLIANAQLKIFNFEH